MSIHLRKPLENLGCPWCDTGTPRICFEEAGANPLHIGGLRLFKCSVPDCVYEDERAAEGKAA